MVSQPVVKLNDHTDMRKCSRCHKNKTMNNFLPDYKLCKYCLSQKEAYKAAKRAVAAAVNNDVAEEPPLAVGEPLSAVDESLPSAAEHAPPVHRTLPPVETLLTQQDKWGAPFAADLLRPGRKVRTLGPVRDSSREAQDTTQQQGGQSGSEPSVQP